MEKLANISKVFILHALAIAFVLLSTQLIHAQEISVVEVKRNITLADDDPVYKDFYINAGEGSSLRKNMVVNVKRKITIKDSGSKTIGDFETTVGQLKVIHIGNKVSVAREFKLTPRDEEAMLDQIGIMTGDRVDLSNSFIDNSKPVYKHKTSEAEPVAPAQTKEAQSAAAPVPSALPAVVAPQGQAPSTTGASVTTKSAATTAKTENTAPPAPAANTVPSQPSLRAPASESTEPSLLQKVIPLPNGAKGL